MTPLHIEPADLSATPTPPNPEAMGIVMGGMNFQLTFDAAVRAIVRTVTEAFPEGADVTAWEDNNGVWRIVSGSLQGIDRDCVTISGYRLYLDNMFAFYVD